MTLPGRNDPCPCGSGKKYKKCCQLSTSPRPEDFLVDRIHRERSDFLPGLLKFTRSNFGTELFAVAAADLWLGDSPLPDTVDDGPLTVPFALFRWVNDEGLLGDLPGIDRKPAAILFLEKEGRRLTELQRSYIIAAAITPYSFHEILECTPGSGMRFRDVLTGAELDVVERMGSRDVSKGDIIFAQVVTVEGISMYEGSAPFRIPPIHKIEIIDLRSRIERATGGPVGPGELIEYQYDFEVLRMIADRLWNPRRPTLTNTDGDPLCPHRLIYEIDDVESVFRRLAPLAKGEDPESLLEEGTRSDSGRLTRIEFPWIKPGNAKMKAMQNTILGDILIEGATLTVEVNSKKRATRIRKRIDQLAGPLVRYRTTVVEPIESRLGKSMPGARSKESEDLNNLPEVQAKLREFHRNHMLSWMDEPVPLLGNITPRAAVKSRDGREKVEAMLTQFEQAERQRRPEDLDVEIYREVRGSLGLD